MYRNGHFFPHLCSIERATVVVDVSTIRDRKVTSYTTQHTFVPCWFEPGGNELVRDDMMGSTVVERYTVWFHGDFDVRVNDRLVKDSSYYLVEALSDYHDSRFHKVAHVRKLNLAEGQV